jgi:hypothetical protein
VTPCANSRAPPITTLGLIKLSHARSSVLLLEHQSCMLEKTSIDHCLDTLSNYGSGRESCTAKVFSPRLGVLSGFVFNAVHRGTLPLANVGRLNLFFKVGTYYYNWSTIGRLVYNWSACFQYILYFSSRWLRLNFCSVVALEPSMSFTSVDHCIDTLSDYVPEREPCTDRAFSPRHGVLSGFVFQRHSQSRHDLWLKSINLIP